MEAPGYEKLAEVLGEAFHQAASGKGKERHAVDLPFHEQPMQALCDMFGPGFALGQAAKKMQESQRLPYGRDRAELLGAIVYCAGAIIALDRAAARAAPDAPANDDAAPQTVYSAWTTCAGCTSPMTCARRGFCQEARRRG